MYTLHPIDTDHSLQKSGLMSFPEHRITHFNLGTARHWSCKFYTWSPTNPPRLACGFHYLIGCYLPCLSAKDLEVLQEKALPVWVLYDFTWIAPALKEENKQMKHCSNPPQKKNHAPATPRYGVLQNLALYTGHSTKYHSQNPKLFILEQNKRKFSRGMRGDS